MKFQKTPIIGAYTVELNPISDDRGFFARSFCQEEFASIGLETTICQSNVSLNAKRGTVRGMHYQKKPFEEAKLVRVTSGKIYDVIIDIRPESPTFKQFFSVELSAQNRQALYVPKGCAHGFQTLEDNTEIFYDMFTFFNAAAAAGFRHNDPAFGITWPLPISIIAPKDLQFPDFKIQ